MPPSNAATLLRGLNPKLAPLAAKMDEQLLSLGCTSYVKTIYVGYDLNGVMVAALYPHTTRIEVALALPEDHASALLIDATHLTWKTLPVAAVIAAEEDMIEVSSLIGEACSRVEAGEHDVERSSEYFAKSRRESTLGDHRPQ